MAAVVEKVLLASPRGYCAGVERAVETVELALEHYGADLRPQADRPQRARRSRARGAGSRLRRERGRGARGRDDRVLRARRRPVCVLARRGARPQHHRRNVPARDQGSRPGARYAADGYTVVLIGHEGHEEVVGTMGEAPESTVLVQSVDDAEELAVAPDARFAYITQTTLSVDETAEIIAVLRRRFPEIHAPKKEDIYATSNRQWAVKELVSEIDLLLVIGSRNRPNSNRLVEALHALTALPHT